MAKDNIEYLEAVTALPIKQGEFEFYVFTISAKKLLSVSYTSERTKSNRTGIQRGLRRDRLITIGRYLQGKISGEPILPNTIIISLSNDSYFENGKLHIANKPAAEAFVIDGQHRLWSFKEEFSGDFDTQIVVSAFFELEDDKKALIFKTINGEQRKINPSLVYDLIPMLRDKNWVEFETWRSQEIVEILNTDEKSPWAGRISMVGESGKIISQSSFMTALKKLFKKGHIFNISDSQDFLETITQEKLLFEYFDAFSNEYSVEWDNKDFFLCKYIGVSAILNLLELIIADLKSNNVTVVDNDGLKIQSKDFKPYTDKLSVYRFSAKTAKAEGNSYVGEGGVNELFRKINQIVFPK
ncbi:DGQHR domain-containing protein [Mucilaginibacter sp. SG564]|uniref:DGQHR domain-containing protein n=1 Tax=Mucilaginibacter sp. SG564 TaxID=2587022 RepID=UPI001555197E|nr:DGQHR domain-containing protein [Mucilaginibacter sp. SG564]NOW96127.1 DGQHR domain-containing protein [Mucilaginibacter sp. SG564]